MYSVQQLRDIYSISWSAFGGRRNPLRRLKVLKAIPALAIAGLFRASEMLRPEGSTFNPLTHLTRGLITFHADDRAWTPIAPTKANLDQMLRERRGFAKVKIPKLKNDQYMNKGFEPVVLSFAEALAPFCTLSLLIEMELDHTITSSAERAKTPMFVDPETGQQFTKTAFARIFTELISLALVQCRGIHMTGKEIRRLFSLHSFRITGANLLRAAGAPAWALKRAGRWLSDCHLEYDRDDLERMCALRVAMFSTKSSAPNVNLPNAGTYPYPKETLHPSLPMPPPARAISGPGTYSVTTEQERAWERDGSYDPTHAVENRALFSTMTPSISDIKGRRVRKKFGRSWHTGTITKDFTKDNQVHVVYDDEDREDLDLADAYSILLPLAATSEKKAKRRRH